MEHVINNWLNNPVIERPTKASIAEQKARNWEQYMHYIVYGFFIGMIAMLWLMPVEWLHWLARVIFTVIFLAIILCVRSLDKAPVYPDDIPTNWEEEMVNREEEALWREIQRQDREMPDQEVAQINYEMEKGELELVNFDSPAAELEHEKWMRKQS